LSEVSTTLHQRIRGKRAASALDIPDNQAQILAPGGDLSLRLFDQRNHKPGAGAG